LEEAGQLLEQKEGDHVAAILGEARSQRDPGNTLVLKDPVAGSNM